MFCTEECILLYKTFNSPVQKQIYFCTGELYFISSYTKFVREFKN